MFEFNFKLSEKMVENLMREYDVEKEEVVDVMKNLMREMNDEKLLMLVVESMGLFNY